MTRVQVEALVACVVAMRALGYIGGMKGAAPKKAVEAHDKCVAALSGESSQLIGDVGLLLDCHHNEDAHRKDHPSPVDFVALCLQFPAAAALEHLKADAELVSLDGRAGFKGAKGGGTTLAPR